VVQLVRQDRHAGAAEGGEQADVGGEAGGEEQRRLGALPRRQVGLELGVQRARADHQSGRARARAPAVEGGVGGGHHDRVVGQAQVVVRGEADDRAAAHVAGHGPGGGEVAGGPPPPGGPDAGELGVDAAVPAAAPGCLPGRAARTVAPHRRAA
jgi:hypothetical protein